MSSTLKKIEFSHTVFHGAKGGITPDFIPDDYEEEADEKEKVKSSPVKRTSKLPTKKPTTAKGSSRGTPSPTSNASSGSKPSPTKPSGRPGIASKPTARAGPSPTKPAPKAAPASKGSARPTTGAGARNMGTSGSLKCDKNTAAAAAADREAQRLRREAEEAEKRRYEEEQERKRKEYQKKRQEGEQERKNKMAQLRKEEAERKKKYEKLEAPFKQVKNKTSPKAGKEEPFIEIGKSPERPKSRPPNEKEATKRPGTGNRRDKDVDDLKKLIREKKAAAKKMKNDPNQIQIGTMIFNLDGEEIKPDGKADQKKAAPPEKKEPMRVEDLVLDIGDDNADDDDLFSLAAIAQNMHDHPPEEDENCDDDDDEQGTVFLFKGKPVDLPAYDGPDPASYRNEAIRKFIEKGLGVDKFLKVYHLVTDQSEQLTEDQCDEELKKILKSDEEMEYYPLIQQLVVAETLNE
ncbi:hypothetical protein TRFO_28913 [Tritrichomonas foetus]|uniref:Uncharacterized protein n=1 Tax=Tritrichomonas foetus TaxID=1144522 RepID=A0A1J4K1N5_9EUKA|nr:hypothetical protein TRFO_28913 [Tritrichomonas foetus]|eukprot:OHT03652.1 hypothetical protein TRFO_28913 [Tritrichomonas foetus]